MTEQPAGSTRGRGAGQEAENSVRHRLRVLLVDDAEENLELLDDVLAEHGYGTLLARNGMDALELLAREDVHLIVADAMMPKMDGFLLCKEVRARPACATIPFVIYTGNYVDEQEQEFARSIGVDRYVVKFAGLGALVNAVNELAHARYGRAPLASETAEETETMDDQAFLEKHRAIIIRKLEEKMAELELFAETLVRKNREIQKSEDRYRTLFDHSGIAIFVIERGTGRVLEVNPRGLSLLGLTKDELLALPRMPLAGDGDPLLTILEATSYVACECSITARDGSVLDVEVGVGPMTQPEDQRILLYVHDVSEQKQMREKLAEGERMTLLGRLAAGIAHEIRNPLSAITLNLQYVLQKLEEMPAERDSIRDALEGARRVETVIENTLNLARLTPPVVRTEDLNTLLQQALGFLTVAIRQKGLRVQIRLADSLPPVQADARQIHQVVLNIVQNAIDASPEGGEVEIASALSAEGVEVTVRDHGPGIPPEIRKRLFEQLQTSKPGGTGLGLLLCKHIMDRHHGSIRLDTAPGEGTVVRILFPVQLDSTGGVHGQG